MVIVPTRLKDLMQLRAISQSELGRRVGVSQATIYKLLVGESYGTRHLHKSARELGTTPAYLTGETDDPEQGAAPQPELTHEEREFLDGVRALSASDRGHVIGLVRSLPKHDRVAPSPSPAAGLPPEPALAQMFEGLLAGLDPEHPDEHALLLARRLPSALAQLKDLLPAAVPLADATPRRRRRTPIAAPSS